VDFGLFSYCQGRGVPHDQAYGEMLDQITLAETLGFGECWFAEHHFTDYSLLPSPNLMIAAALQRTTRVRFGNYVNVLPFHHPLRLAAEASAASATSRTRRSAARSSCSPKPRFARGNRPADHGFLTGISDGPLSSAGRISNSRCWFGLSVLL
jgi:Luciferase-like monooxygenase